MEINTYASYYRMASTGINWIVRPRRELKFAQGGFQDNSLRKIFLAFLLGIVYKKQAISGEDMEVLSVTRSVSQYLRDCIITGELAPGQKLNEIELSSRLGISRPPLREAFRLIESEHLVVSVPRRGCYVTTVSAENCRQIFQVREMIECYVIDLLKAKNTRDLPSVHSALVSASDSWPPLRNKEGGTTHNPFPHFHIKLVESTGNHFIMSFYNSIASSLARYQFMCTYVPGVPEQAQDDHKQILDFIKGGEYDLAREFLKFHIRGMLTYIEQVISQKNHSQ
jgi:DNA-binding GntR family transcriptional regulator